MLKGLNVVLLLVDFPKAFHSIHRDKNGRNPSSYSIPNETVKTTMMLYKNTYSVVRHPNGDTDFFEIVAGMLQGDILAHPVSSSFG